MVVVFWGVVVFVCGGCGVGGVGCLVVVVGLEVVVGWVVMVCWVVVVVSLVDFTPFPPLDFDQVLTSNKKNNMIFISNQLHHTIIFRLLMSMMFFSDQY